MSLQKKMLKSHRFIKDRWDYEYLFDFDRSVTADGI